MLRRIRDWWKFPQPEQTPFDREECERMVRHYEALIDRRVYHIEMMYREFPETASLIYGHDDVSSAIGHDAPLNRFREYAETWRTR